MRRREGEVVDLVGGLADLDSRTVRFIGDAETRIREDFLRVLRFFRFFAWYGAGRPDAEGLKACARLKDGLDQLSAERVWAELKKLLAAPDPVRALLWMRQAGVLTRILPESEKWGIDFIHPLVRAEADLGWPADPLLRLEALVPPDAERRGGARGAAAVLDRRGNAAESLGGGARRSRRPPPNRRWHAALCRRPRRHSWTGLRLALAIARGKAGRDDGAMMEAGGYSRLLALRKNGRSRYSRCAAATSPHAASARAEARCCAEEARSRMDRIRLSF